MDDLDLGATIKGFSPGQKVFNRYTLRKILGRGGMGVVWLAHDGELDRDIALKFLPEVVAMDKQSVFELKRETRRSLELTHPHIVRIHDFVQDGRAAAISMEYVAGDSLAALKMDQPDHCYGPGQLAKWVKQLCEALDYAHQKAEVVHRDLKPANLMIDARGDLKIADFGIAASVSDSVSRVSAQAGSSGTPVFMSPQQMMGEKPAVTDDIYALGATLYDLLTGKPPFHSGNIMMQVQNKVPPALTERRKEFGITGEEIPPAWEQTIAACLAKDTVERPASARDVAHRLGLAPAATVAPFSIHSAPTKPAPANASQATKPSIAPLPRNPDSKPKTPLRAGLAAAGLILAGLGYYFGVHAPEQARLAAERVRQTQEQARLAAEQAKLAEAARLEEQKRLAAEAAERKRQEEIAARLAAARGGLVIRTEPSGAEVRVGSVALDKSPLSAKDLKLGKYPVRVRMAGYEDYDSEIEVKENEFADPGLIRLERSTGMVRLTTVPVGVEYRFTPLPADEGDRAVKFDGRTPVEPLKLPTGKYEVVFDRSGWGSTKQTVTVTRGGEEKISADLRGGSIDVQSEPAGATVRLQGKVAGTTPLLLTDVPWRTPAQITVELPVHAPVKQELSPQPGQVVPLRLQLQRLPTRVKLVELPTSLKAPIKAAWSGRDLPIASDGTVELPGDGGTGRLSVSYGPTVWEKEMTIAAGQTVEVKPDLILRFDISRAPRVTRLKADSAMSGYVTNSSTESQEITWKRQENGHWVECEARIGATANSYKLVANEIYEPGTRYGFVRTSSGWNVTIVSGGMKMKALKNYKPPAPASAASWLTKALRVLPTTPVLPGDSWEVSPADFLSTGLTALQSPSGRIQGRLASLQMENGQQIAVFSYDVDLQGSMGSYSQTVRGTLEIRAVMNGGWVPYFKSKYAIKTAGLGDTIISDTVVTEEPVQ